MGRVWDARQTGRAELPAGFVPYLWAGDERRLAVDYDRWHPVGAAWLPARIRARAQGGFRAEIEFDAMAARDSFTAAEFQVDGNPEGR